MDWMEAQCRACAPPLSLSPNPLPNVHASSHLEHCGFSLVTDFVSPHLNLAFVKTREISLTQTLFLTLTLSMMKPMVLANIVVLHQNILLIVATLDYLGAFENEIFDTHPQGEEDHEVDDEDENDDDSSTSRLAAVTNQVCKGTTRSLPRRVL
jgi:hypothetical protein